MTDTRHTAGRGARLALTATVIVPSASLLVLGGHARALAARPVAPVVTIGSHVLGRNVSTGEDQVVITNSVPLTALGITITTPHSTGLANPRAGDVSFSGLRRHISKNPDGSYTYTFVLRPGATLPVGAGWVVGARFDFLHAAGRAHDYSADSYSVTATGGGATATTAGHFAAVGLLAISGATSTPAPVATATRVPASLAPGTPGPGSVSVVGSVSPRTSGYFGQEAVTLGTTAPLTALTITVTVQKTPGLRFKQEYDTYRYGELADSYVDTGSQIVYTYQLRPGQTVPAGTGLVTGSQWYGNGTTRTTTADTYSVQVTPAGGTPLTYSGHF